MRIFVMAVQNGSLSAAGRQIGMSPASVSRHVNALEDEVGSRLLNRSSRKLTLTEAGQIYMRHAEEILNRLEEASSRISQLQRSPRGTLRVHSRILIGTQHIVPAIPEFLRRFPDVKVDLRLSNHVIDLVEQNIDVDIRIGKLQDSSFIAKKLLGSERVLCASPRYLGKHPPIREPADLRHHSCLTYYVNSGATIWCFADGRDVLTDVSVDGPFQSDHGPALRDLALAHAGIILMPDWSVRDDIATGALVRVLPEFRVSYGAFENGVYAVYQGSRHLSAKVRLFVDFLSERFRGHPGPGP